MPIIHYSLPMSLKNRMLWKSDMAPSFPLLGIVTFTFPILVAWAV